MLGMVAEFCGASVLPTVYLIKASIFRLSRILGRIQRFKVDLSTPTTGNWGENELLGER